jgi:alpha-tubulin suppressor-like RCC1 family protein
LGLNNEEKKLNPTRVESTKNKNFIKIESKSSHSLGLSKSGVVYGWVKVKLIKQGGNQLAQLGLGHKFSVLAPTKIPFEEKVKKISTSARHSMFLTEEGTVYSCG